MKTTDVKEWAGGNFSNKKPHALNHMFPNEDTNVMQENTQVDFKKEISGYNGSQ